MARYAIDEIRGMTERATNARAFEWVDVKGFRCYLVDLGIMGDRFDGFGYSMLVYRNGRQAWCMNDYALHHPNRSRDELRARYLDEANERLFTEGELCAPSVTYAEQRRKEYFVYNVLPSCYGALSFYVCGTTPEGWYRDVITRNYWPNDGDAAHVIYLIRTLRDSEPRTYDYLKGAFRYQMSNTEYCFAMNYHSVLSYFSPDVRDALREDGWNDVKQAWCDAEREYMDEMLEAGVI